MALPRKQTQDQAIQRAKANIKEFNKTRASEEFSQAINEVKNLSPDQIAEKLRTRKILGRPGTVGRCPLALLLHGAYGGRFVVGQKFIIRQSGSNVDKIETPKNLASFVRRFDAGDYADLIQVPPRCLPNPKPRSTGTGIKGKPHSTKRGADRLQLTREVGRRAPTTSAR